MNILEIRGDWKIVKNNFHEICGTVNGRIYICGHLPTFLLLDKA
jgi:hypothetical protein